MPHRQPAKAGKYIKPGVYSLYATWLACNYRFLAHSGLACCPLTICVFCVSHVRLHCCGWKLREGHYTASQWLNLCGDGEAKPHFGPLDDPSDNLRCTVMLAHKRVSDPRANENGLAGGIKLSKAPVALKSSASIRDKISQWEGKKDTTPPPSSPCLLIPPGKDPEITRRDNKPAELHRGDSKKFVSWEKQDSGKENAGNVGDLQPKSPEGPVKDREGILEKGSRGKSSEAVQDKRLVLTHIKKLEQAMKEGPSKPALVLPGNYFSPPAKEEQEEADRKAAEPIFGTLDIVRPGEARRERHLENVYTEPGEPSVNPLPKPQRTFQHHTRPGTPGSPLVSGKGRRNLPPLPSIPPPPLPTCPPPGVNRRPWADRTRNSSNRYSE